MGSRVGGSFTGLTVSTKLWLTEPPLASVTVSVISAVPNWLVAGVILSVRLEPLPPKTIFWLGTRMVLGGSGSSRTLRITPATNQFGTALITLTDTDANGGS